MLDHLRQRAVAALSSATAAQVITDGPAGLQASLWPCEASDLRLYILISSASDHLVNLEVRRDVMLTTDRWRLEGEASPLTRAAAPDLSLWERAEAPWSTLIAVSARRLHLLPDTGWGDGETLDLD